jgi:lysozyme family protein
MDFLNLLVKAIDKTKADKAPTAPSVSLFPNSIGLISPLSSGMNSKPLNQNDMISFVMTQEGSKYVAKDGGKESSRYGILQTTAERFGYQDNVKNMSKQEAENIYKKMWQDSGAQNLKPDLALVHFDTYVNSPSAANKMLKACDGNVDDYISMRSNRYNRLSSLRPERYGKYLKGWMNRIENLRSAVAENNNLSPSKATT